MSRKTRWWTAFGLLAALAASWGGYQVYSHHRYRRFLVHEPHMVYRSGWVEPEVFRELIEDHQIRAVVNLCNPGEMGEERWVKQRAAVKNSGARLIELPMPGVIDSSDPRFRRHVDVLGNPENYPILIHCQHGVTRTAKMLAIYDIVYRNMTAQQSLEQQPLFGRPDHPVTVKAFAADLQRRQQKLFPQTATRLDVLRQ